MKSKVAELDDKFLKEYNIVEYKGTGSYYNEEGLVSEYVVLRHDESQVQSWFTHRMFTRDESIAKGRQKVAFFWGNYFDTEEEARENFDARE